MSPRRDRPWTAHIVMATEHAGLKPYFQKLEDALYGCLSELDDPRHVRDFLTDTTSHLRWERGRIRRLADSDGRRKGR